MFAKCEILLHTGEDWATRILAWTSNETNIITLPPTNFLYLCYQALQYHEPMRADLIICDRHIVFTANFSNFTVTVEYVPEEHKTHKSFNPDDIQVCYEQRDKVPKSTMITVICNRPLVGNQLRIQLGSLDTQLVLCDIRIFQGRIRSNVGIDVSKPLKTTSNKGNLFGNLDTCVQRVKRLGHFPPVKIIILTRIYIK